LDSWTTGRSDGATGNFICLLDFDAGSSGNASYRGGLYCWASSDGSIGINMHNNTSSPTMASYASSTGLVSLNTWHTAVITRNASTGALVFYIDGQAGGTTTGYTGAIKHDYSVYNTNNIRIFGFDSSIAVNPDQGFVDGKFGAFAIFNKVLTASEASGVHGEWSSKYA
tara:strand:+ start:99 stop:605 length:507 start_codon:yes stop_codon:yes gene_type:complete